eukprot:GHVN01031430.1.p1 GENE.GHVN01031430.1~~GHVN01031430.1.p1  ORF type:complete len:370 (-),score=43.98 GHVN01031430.1:436-1545(-)
MNTNDAAVCNGSVEDVRRCDDRVKAEYSAEPKRKDLLKHTDPKSPHSSAANKREKPKTGQEGVTNHTKSLSSRKSRGSPEEDDFRHEQRFRARDLKTKEPSCPQASRARGNDAKRETSQRRKRPDTREKRREAEHREGIGEKRAEGYRAAGDIHRRSSWHDRAGHRRKRRHGRSRSDPSDNSQDEGSPDSRELPRRRKRRWRRDSSVESSESSGSSVDSDTLVATGSSGGGGVGQEKKGEPLIEQITSWKSPVEEDTRRKTKSSLAPPGSNFSLGNATMSELATRAGVSEVDLEQRIAEEVRKRVDAEVEKRVQQALNNPKDETQQKIQKEFRQRLENHMKEQQAAAVGLISLKQPLFDFKLCCHSIRN